MVHLKSISIHYNPTDISFFCVIFGFFFFKIIFLPKSDFRGDLVNWNIHILCQQSSTGLCETWKSYYRRALTLGRVHRLLMALEYVFLLKYFIEIPKKIIHKTDLFNKDRTFCFWSKLRFLTKIVWPKFWLFTTISIFVQNSVVDQNFIFNQNSNF